MLGKGANVLGRIGACNYHHDTANVPRMIPQETRSAERGEITALLSSLRRGDAQAEARLVALVYDDLRRLARRERGRRGAGQTLDTTALVHEVYLRLAQPLPDLVDRQHLLSVAVMAMRQILLDHCRRSLAHKRGGDAQKVDLRSSDAATEAKALELLAIDDALQRLQSVDARAGRVVELRFFGGMTVEETADVMSISVRTVKREWRKARAFLFQLLDVPEEESVDG